MTNALESTEQVGRPASRGVMIATCVSTLVVNANTSAVTILLPAIAKDVGASVDTLRWAVTGHSLVGAACIVTWSALGIPLAIAAKRARSRKPGTIDYVAAAAAHTHTLPRRDPTVR